MEHHIKSTDRILPLPHLCNLERDEGARPSSQGSNEGAAAHVSPSGDDDGKASVQAPFLALSNLQQRRRPSTVSTAGTDLYDEDELDSRILPPSLGVNLRQDEEAGRYSSPELADQVSGVARPLPPTVVRQSVAQLGSGESFISGVEDSQGRRMAPFPQVWTSVLGGGRDSRRSGSDLAQESPSSSLAPSLEALLLTLPDSKDEEKYSEETTEECKLVEEDWLDATDALLDPR